MLQAFSGKNSVLIGIIGVLFLIFGLVGSVATHASVMVQPDSVTKDSEQVFDFIVTADKAATTEFIVEIPQDLNEVRPLVKDKWNIDLEKGSDDTITKVTWRAGTIIPQGSAETFQLVGNIESKQSQIQWSVSQTNIDGSTTNYGIASTNEDPVFQPLSTEIKPKNGNSQFGFYLAFVALAVALFALLASYLTGQKVDAELSSLLKKAAIEEPKPKVVKASKSVNPKTTKKPKAKPASKK
jgi:uncharacterized protein YcnI